MDCNNFSQNIGKFIFAFVIILTIADDLFAIKLIEFDDISDSSLLTQLDRIIWKRVKTREYRNFFYGRGVVKKIEDSKLGIRNLSSDFVNYYYTGSFIPSNISKYLKIGDNINYYSLFNVLYYIEVDVSKVNVLVSHQNEAPNNKFSESRDTKREMINYIEHKLKKGETLWSLSRLYQVEIEAIRRINGLEPNQNKILAGKIYKIPSQGKQKKSIISNSEFIIYEVKEGETLWSLSKKYDVTIDAIRKFNDLRPNQDKIFAGKKYKIPVLKKKD